MKEQYGWEREREIKMKMTAGMFEEYDAQVWGGNYMTKDMVHLRNKVCGGGDWGFKKMYIVTDVEMRS